MSDTFDTSKPSYKEGMSKLQAAVNKVGGVVADLNTTLNYVHPSHKQALGSDAGPLEYFLYSLNSAFDSMKSRLSHIDDEYDLRKIEGDALVFDSNISKLKTFIGDPYGIKRSLGPRVENDINGIHAGINDLFQATVMVRQ